ncbi:GNAT family N-acetyltransferase [Pseudochelatococcus sp. G4_1912]|uniref:GNAT family N-acetyltransferase n=1 Tax=Pseudochelatococcus sp. G4_1912 TaxID=3114288 RepID=UPI0039C68AB5
MMEAVINNTEKQRFEVTIDGATALIDYHFESHPNDEHKIYVFVHTEVPPALGGKGVGTHLATGALDIVRAEGAKIRSECSFISAYLARNPQYKDIQLN